MRPARSTPASRWGLAALAAGCASPEPTATPEPAAEAHAAAPNPAAMDRAPAGLLRSPRWEARVAEGGALTVAAQDPTVGDLSLDREVDPRLAFAPDDTALYYARRGPLGETDLWRVSLPTGERRQVTAWLGSEDRPVVSPDGRRLAFVSGRTGIASWWVVSLDGALPAEAGVQLTNVGVESKPRSPGHPPEGFVPVPDGTTYGWTDAGLTWESRGQPYTVAVPAPTPPGAP